MKIYIVFKAECIYDNSFDKAFSNLGEARKYVDKNIQSYLVYLSDMTLLEIYDRAIHETELIGKFILGDGSGNDDHYQAVKDAM